jgi:cytosine/adenosine deaminase-related metal-dependent hydrolase
VGEGAVAHPEACHPRPIDEEVAVEAELGRGHVVVADLAADRQRILGPRTLVAAMAFDHNAAIASRFFPRPLGALASGACADIILLDYAPHTPLTDGNYPWHLIFGLDGSHVTHTICGGQLLMRDRGLLTLDEAAIAAHARALAPAIWRRVEAM